MNNFNSFLSNIKKVKGERKHKIKNSYGIKDYYKYYKETQLNPLSLKEYTRIFKEINKQLKNLILQGEEITFPCKMGKLEIRKYKGEINFKNGKIKTNLPIDWNATLHLWYEDEEARKNKTLIKMQEEEIYKILYNKSSAQYINKSFYLFNVNRDIKIQLKKLIKDNNLDAFLR